MPKKVDIATTVAEATILARKVKEDSARLEELKSTIRAAAEKMSKKQAADETTVEIASPEGVCTVVFPCDSTVLKKGANPYVMQGEIPEHVWTILFDEKVSLAKDFTTKLSNLPKVSGFTLNARGQTLVDSLIELKPNAPRVCLAK